MYRQAGSCTSPSPCSHFVLNGESCSARQSATAEMKPAMPERESVATRKGHTPINVWVTPDEKYEITLLAKTTGLSTSKFLRNLGMGYQVKSIIDNKRVEELARINGDLGRLGGLLKLWLTDDLRTRRFGESTIRALLSKIDQNQNQMYEAMREVVMPRSKR